MPVPDVDEVLVRVRACGVSYRDVVERNGTYRRDVSYPLILGLEISGIVVETGARVRDLHVGNHVCTKAFSSCGSCRDCRNGRETSCRLRRPVRGGYAEFTALPQDAVVRVPERIPFECSCALGPGAGVALNAVRDVAHAQLGETVLVTGASGGVGLAAVQIAKLAGAHVIAASRTDAKSRFLLEAGADEVVTGGDFSRRVRDLTRGDGVEVIIDTVGSRVFDSAFDSLAIHGRYAFVGELFGQPISINPARIFFKRAQLLGVGSVSRTQLEQVIGLAAAGKLRSHVGQILPLDQIGRAHQLVEDGTVFGRVVVTP